jgi:MFS family permease
MTLLVNCVRPTLPYLVVIGAMWVNVCNFAVLRSSSVLYMALMDDFGCSYEQATWTFTLIGGVGSLTTVIAGFLTHYLSIRLVVGCGVALNALSIAVCSHAVTVQQIIGLGALQGVGVGLFVGLLPVIVAQHFDRGRSTACGFCYIGCTFSSMIFPRLIQHMILSRTLSDVFELLAIVSAFGFLGALLLFPAIKSSESSSQSSIELTNASVSQVIADKSTVTIGSVQSVDDTTRHCQSAWQRWTSDLRLFGNVHFQLLSLVYVTYIFTYLVFVIILQAFAEERGLDKWQANSLIVYFSMADLPGRLLPGLLHLLGIVSNRTTYVTSMALLGISFVLMPVIAHDLTSFVMLVCFSGLMNGVQMTLPAVVMSEYLGKSLVFSFRHLRLFRSLKPFRCKSSRTSSICL